MFLQNDMCRPNIFHQFLGKGSRGAAVYDELQKGLPNHEGQNNKGKHVEFVKTDGVTFRFGRCNTAKLIINKFVLASSKKVFLISQSKDINLTKIL